VQVAGLRPEGERWVRPLEDQAFFQQASPADHLRLPHVLDKPPLA